MNKIEIKPNILRGLKNDDIFQAVCVMTSFDDNKSITASETLKIANEKSKEIFGTDFFCLKV